MGKDGQDFLNGDRPRRAAKLEAIRASGYLDPDWYRARYPDVTLLGMDPAEHFLSYGAAMGRDPGPCFSTRFHYDMNPEAERRGRNPIIDHLDPISKTDEIESPKRRNVVWAASRLAERDPDLALRLARKGLTPNRRHALEILLANQMAHDEAAWLGHLNRYLSPFGIAPVELTPAADADFGIAGRLGRLRSGPLPAVESGPLVSVILPAWNAEDTLAFAARSILDQTWRPIELIVVDDASTDGTWRVARELAAGDERVRLMRNERNVGPYVSKNLALTQVRGRFVTGHDADDWALPQRIEHHVRFHQADGRELKASTSLMLRMTADGRFGKFSPPDDLTRDGVALNCMISCLFETDALRTRLGYWDNVRFGADSEMISRAALVFGDSFDRSALMAMICLDLETSLTNHHEHGVHNPQGRFMPIRRSYKRNWLRWHGSLNAASAYQALRPAMRPFPAPPAMRNQASDIEAVVAGYEAQGIEVERPADVECDLCLASDLSFPGGTASCTLTDAAEAARGGARVALLHIPTNPRRPDAVCDRYAPWADRVTDGRRFDGLTCTSLVIRHPRVVCSPAFEDLRGRVRPERTHVVLNNGLWRNDGTPVYDPSALVRRLRDKGLGEVSIHPISPVVRAEIEEAGIARDLAPLLSPDDWVPIFEVPRDRTPPKPRLTPPFRIGRHGRDREDKWLEDARGLRAAYPDHPDVRVSMLGGGEVARGILGELPGNWEVLPFGAEPAEDYLRRLDAFVYFPHTRYAEAFGRVVPEAMIAGVPCILASRFAETFGDLAFYGDPGDVLAMLRRLACDDGRRTEFLTTVQRRAAALYASDALSGRLPELGLGPAAAARDATTALPDEQVAYRRWVETGR